MGPSGKILIWSLGIFCLSVLILSPNFDLAKAAPAENPNLISIEEYEDDNSIEKRTENSNSNLTVPGEERGGHFEGDMILPELAATSGIRSEAARWPNAVVIYQMDSKFSRGEVDVIKGAMREISEKTCVQFKARVDEPDYVKITRGQFESGCNAHVGYLGYAQSINLEPEFPNSRGTCVDKGTVIHEILHTLGFVHEQSRTDRDDFVTINVANIEPKMFSANFQKYGSDIITDFNISYDYNSIMHYEWNAFANDTKIPTIIPKKSGVQIGQRKGLSEKDVQKINAMYSKTYQKCSILTLESKMEMTRQQMEMMRQQMSATQDKLSALTAEGEKNEKARNSYATISRARLYSKPNFSGVAEDYNFSPYYYNPNCYNLQNISTNVKSIWTFDSCIRVYSKRDCTGSMRPFLPGLNDHKNILDFEVVSIGQCFETPHFGRSTETLRNGLDAVLRTDPKARLYSELNQTGEIEEYNLVGTYGVFCKNLTSLAGKVKSVDSLGRCVRLFGTSDCGGRMLTIDPLTSSSIRDNILGVLPEGVASVGPCWEIPHGEHSLGKLKSRLDKMSTP